MELQSLISNNVLQGLLISFRTKYAHTDYSFDFAFHYLLMHIYFESLAIQVCQEHTILQDWSQNNKKFYEM